MCPRLVKILVGLVKISTGRVKISVELVKTFLGDMRSIYSFEESTIFDVNYRQSETFIGPLIEDF